MEKMMAAQSGLMDRIAELENALAKEREKTQAMGERLRTRTTRPTKNAKDGTPSECRTDVANAEVHHSVAENREQDGTQVGDDRDIYRGDRRRKQRRKRTLGMVHIQQAEAEQSSRTSFASNG
ncbi:hypothetical protein HPB50_023659 [Hyalomma asiaticum]|uniref:Uncharacterized protein n=1 Tax=Hyalomma asiaticum TaxID=266040 RepID=A0ACB7T6U0_HYAAI|nr:hypothetical protein HPB50_023659 [Hyalomma asiaticum]